MSGSYTAEDVLAFRRPTDDFLCPITANVYGIEFLSFEIRDVDSGAIVFKVRTLRPPLRF
jgi:hypothetical protein